MSKTKIVLNHAGITALLKSDEIKTECEKHAQKIAQRCGVGYAHDTYLTPSRIVASAYTETAEAYKDNLENNTLLKAMGG